jgi:hypothetical protein
MKLCKMFILTHHFTGYELLIILVSSQKPFPPVTSVNLFLRHVRGLYLSLLPFKCLVTVIPLSKHAFIPPTLFYTSENRA